MLSAIHFFLFIFSERKFIISKFGVAWKSVNYLRAKTYIDLSPEYLVTALENSLRRLQIEAIPLYMVHWPDPDFDLKGTFEVLEKMRCEGKILNYGVSNFGKSEITPDISRLARK